MVKIPLKYSVVEQCPQFIRDEPDNQYFIYFLEAYYEWLENNNTKYTRELNLYRAIDTSIDEFFEYFRYEFLNNIPASILTNKPLVVKNIKQFYRKKGTEKSFQFLFYMLYNDKINFYYPKINIIKPSDGKWQEKSIIKVEYKDVEVDLDSKKIVGVTSGATAIIESVIQANQNEIEYYEISITDIKGTFTSQEYINIIEEDVVYYNGKLFDLVDSITVTNPGSNYKKGNNFYLNLDGKNVGFGQVTKISTSEIKGLTLLTEGKNYVGRYKNVTHLKNLKLNDTFNGKKIFQTTIIGDSNFSFASTTINELLDTPVLVNNSSTPDKIIISDTLSSNGKGAEGEIYIVDDDGKVQEVKLLKKGNSLYSDPSYKIETLYGVGCTIQIIGGGGSILNTQLKSFPIYDENILVDFTKSGAGNATAVINDKTIIAKTPGVWLTTDSLLSTDQVFQDNYYYQTYSYVINTSIERYKWKDLMKNIIHPAGTIGFAHLSHVVSGLILDIKNVFSSKQLFNLNTYSFNVVVIDKYFVVRTEQIAISTDDLFTGEFKDLEILQLKQKHINIYKNNHLNDSAASVNAVSPLTPTYFDSFLNKSIDGVIVVDSNGLPIDYA